MDACLQAARGVGEWPVDETRAALKVELRPATRCAEAMTRAISPGGFGQMVAAKALGYRPLQWLLSHGPAVSCMTIGVNASDPRQWGYIERVALGGLGGMCGAGDLSRQDRTTGPERQHEVARVRGEVARMSGYSAEDAEAEAVAARMGYESVEHIDGVAVYQDNRNPSGQWATDYGNCLDTMLDLGAAFYLLRPSECNETFFQAVRGVFHGDDHKFKVSPGIERWFTAEAINRVLGDYGVTYTAEDKTLSFGSFYRPSEEVVYLQRKARWVDTELGPMCAAPLGMERLYRRWLVCEEPRALTNAAYYYGLALDTGRELVHHGREAHAAFIGALGGQPVRMADGSWFDPRTLPTFDEMFQDWLHGRLRTWESGPPAAYAEGAEETATPTMDKAPPGGPQGGSPGQVEAGPTTEVSGNPQAFEGAPSDEAPSLPGNMHDTLHRPILIATASLSSTLPGSGAPWVGINPLAAAAALPAYSRKLANSYLLVGGRARLIISTAGTPQHGGAVLIGVMPPGDPARLQVAPASFIASQALQAGFVVHDLSGPRETVIDYPLATPAGPVNMTRAADFYCGIMATPYLQIKPFAGLSHCLLTPVPAVTLQVRFMLLEGELVGPTDEYAYTVTMEPANPEEEFRALPLGWRSWANRYGPPPEGPEDGPPGDAAGGYDKEAWRQRRYA